MRLTALVLFVAAALCLPTNAAIAEPANFSGHWVIDEDASDSMDAILKLQDISWVLRKAAEGLDHEVTIKQEATQLTATFDNLLGNAVQVLVFDGKPHKTQNPAGGEVIWSTSWNDDQTTLISSGPTTTEGVSAILTEKRSLSADGSQMILAVEVVTSDGQKGKANRIFKRQ